MCMYAYGELAGQGSATTTATTTTTTTAEQPVAIRGKRPAAGTRHLGALATNPSRDVGIISNRPACPESRIDL